MAVSAMALTWWWRLGDRSLLLRNVAWFLLASDLAISSAWVMGFSGAVMAIILALVAAEAVGGHVAGAGGVKEPLASCLTDKQVISLRVTAILRDLSRTFSIFHI